MKKLVTLLVACTLLFTLASCGNKQTGETEKQKIVLFAAKSLNGVCDEIIAQYNKDHSDVEIVTNYDSSGTLMEQIKEGAECDIFFSAAQKQMDTLADEGLVEDGTRKNVVNNQVCVVTYKGSNTKVTGLKDLTSANNMALADGSVPVGKYTRQALVNLGILPKADDVSLFTTEEVSKALGGMEINECGNVGAVTAAVSEGSNEVGTVYKSDTFGLEDKLEILEVVGYDVTGDVIYPVAQIKNAEADDNHKNAAKDFLEYLTSDHAKELYEKYYFDTNVE